MVATFIAMLVVAVFMFALLVWTYMRPSYEEREARQILDGIEQYLARHKGQWLEISAVADYFRLGPDSATDAVKQLAAELPSSVRAETGRVIMWSGFIPGQRQPGSCLPAQLCEERT